MATILETVRAAVRWTVARAGIRSERGSVAVEHALIAAAFAIMTVGALAVLAALTAPATCTESWETISPNC